jgi:hypothetical protein
MKTGILIVTHIKDCAWLQYCLRSIKKFATGFAEVMLVVPCDELSHFVAEARTFECRVAGFDQAPPPYGHLDHQVQKCLADSHLSDCDFILHLDSDCMFIEPVTPDDYFVDGKPVLLLQSYKSLSADVQGWKAVTEKALGIETPFETMRRHPAVHYKTIYQPVREAVAAEHGMRFRKYVLAQKATFQYGFSEFNTLGAWVVANCPTKYQLIDVGTMPRPKDKLVQFWSHSPPGKPQNVYINSKLETIIPADYAEKVLE